MLNSKLQQLKDYFGITNPEDWQSIPPGHILAMDGVGPKTLDYLRLLLAHRGITLKGDRTPEYWQQHISEAQVVDAVGNELIDGASVDRGLVCPFTVLIDTAEQTPFTFQGLYADAGTVNPGSKEAGPRPLIVHTERQALGRFPLSLGDYSLSTGLGRCHIERKSMQDAHSTFLGWARKGEDVGRRERFEQELGRLSEIEAGLVVVECSLEVLLQQAPQYGHRTASQNSKTLFRSILSWQQKYDVQWMFAGGRRLAEQYAFRWLEKWDKKDRDERKAAAREGRREVAAEQGELLAEVSEELAAL